MRVKSRNLAENWINCIGWLGMSPGAPGKAQFMVHWGTAALCPSHPRVYKPDTNA